MDVVAAVLRKAGGRFDLETVTLDAPAAGEVLVRVVACGVCHTDIGVQHMMPLPIVLGHEGSGIVEAVGPNVSKVVPGDRVVMTFGSCGGCASCVEGAPSHCHNMRILQFSGGRADGSPTMQQKGEKIFGAFFQQSSFATHALATERNVVKVTNSAVPLELLGPLGCGIQTGAGAVLNTIGARPGSSLAVMGAGSVGLSGIMAARLVGCTTIVAVDVNESRLELAQELGASHAFDARDGDVSDRIRSATGGGANYALETAGTVQSFTDAISCLAMRGVCGIVTVPNRGAAFEFSARYLLTGGRTVVGVLEGSSVPDVFIPQLIEFYAQGRFPMDRLATYYPLDRINDAVADSVAGKAIKPILRMQ
ncbi:MAG: NAD(P)-dependent alcohol dehydrogenase [Proteobacteria bacterium]|nr:NAD(P)-dependent alcohol dehydrogenase [Pseudomonadota bacterium]MDA1057115.1 NAD(P)-dependent alcohol dehydrogenase [Pseudomonadota bacterium]